MSAHPFTNNNPPWHDMMTYHGGLQFIYLSNLFHHAFLQGSLISLENIPCIYLVLHVVEYSIITVGKDCAALRLEFFDVIDHD